MSSENAETDAIINLLDDALNDFKPPSKTTDDELDELMQKVDSEATEKAANKFQDMLQRMVDSVQKEEATESNNTSSSKKLAEEGNVVKELSNLIFSDAGDKQISEALGKLPLSKGSLDDLMESIIQTAVSKELMYPAVKELYEKLSPYLEEKKDELEAVELDRYRQQHRILGRLLEIYNKDPGTDEKAREDRASTIANLWMEMQKYGLPPPEFSRNLPSDPAGPSTAAIEENTPAADCSLM